jgi:hypothetical protein
MMALVRPLFSWQVSGNAERASHCPAEPVWGFLPRLFLPGLSWRRTTDKGLVGQPFSYNAVADLVEAVGIGALSSIVPERFFIEISKQVKRLNTDIGTLDGPLQEAPEILNSVGMDFAPDVGFSVVDNLVGVGVSHTGIAAMFIGVHAGTWGHAPAYLAGQGAAAGVLDYLGLDCAGTVRTMAFKQAHNGGLANGPTALDYCLPLGLVHEPGLASDVSLVRLNLAGHPAEIAVLHCQADAVEHEPGGLLSDADGPMYFVGTDAVLGVGNHPDGGQPFVQSDGAILENGPGLDRKLPPRVLAPAFPNSAGMDEPYIVTTTGGASNHAIRPSDVNHEVQANVGIGEVADGFNQGSWFIHGVAPFLDSVYHE